MSSSSSSLNELSAFGVFSTTLAYVGLYLDIGLIAGGSLVGDSVDWVLGLVCVSDLKEVDVVAVSVSVSKCRVHFSFDCLPTLERDARFLQGGLSFVIMLLIL